MRRVFRYKCRMIRFRRWSRKAYSTFCSIGKHVTIGHISAGIANASLKKSKSVSLMAVVSPFGYCLSGDSEMERNGFASPPVSMEDIWSGSFQNVAEIVGVPSFVMAGCIDI